MPKLHVKNRLDQKKNSDGEQSGIEATYEGIRGYSKGPTALHYCQTIRKGMLSTYTWKSGADMVEYLGVALRDYGTTRFAIQGYVDRHS